MEGSSLLQADGDSDSVGLEEEDEQERPCKQPGRGGSERTAET